MGARGFNLAQEGHTVPVVPPSSIAAGVTGQAFSLKNAAKCNLTIYWGSLASAPGAVTLNACTTLAGANPTPIAFDLFQQAATGAGNDVLKARQSIPSTGYVPANVPNTADVLHVQADQLPDGYPYLQIVLAPSASTTAAVYASVTAMLSGVRFQGESNQSATV